MEIDPVYKVNQKVSFRNEKGNTCYGDIVSICPVNYGFYYNIQINDDRLGKVMKSAVDEKDIIAVIDGRKIRWSCDIKPNTHIDKDDGLWNTNN